MNRKRSAVNTGADERYMRLAIRLAKKAAGLTNPNPAVGAVVVKDSRIVGTGYHKRRGLPHAEINALNDAGARARGGVLYVTLEPCDHFGRTPPCTDSVIRSGVKKVVIAMRDPNPVNNGRGIARLKSRGIKTVVGILEDEAKSINLPYIKYITKKTPYVTVKIAESIDGKIATRTGESRWITSERSRKLAHRLRRKVDAVMVGVNTLIKDDPVLLSKFPGRKQPVRIIVDSRLRSSLKAKMFDIAFLHPVVIATTKSADCKAAGPYRAKGVNILTVKSKSGKVDLKSLLKLLGKMEMAHVMVEGGGELVWAMVDEGLVDRFIFFIAPRIIGGRDAVTAVEGDGIKKIQEAVGLKVLKIKKIAEDILVEAEVDTCSQE